MSDQQITPEVNMQVLQDMVLFDFIVGGSTGERTIDSDDFIREVGRMLPKGAFSWVAKYRSEAKREVLKCGAGRRVNNRIRGYFVYKDKAEQVAQALSDIRTRFNAERDTFLEGLPQLIEDWANHESNQVKTPSGKLRSEIIRENAPQTKDLQAALCFAISAHSIGATSYFGADDALNAEVSGLAGQAAVEIASDINRSWKGPVGGRTSRRVISLITRVRDKAEAMSFISDRFDLLRTMCNDVLSKIPADAMIEGSDFLLVSSLLSYASKPENILGVASTDIDPLIDDDSDETPQDDADPQADIPQDVLSFETPTTQADQTEPATEQLPNAEENSANNEVPALGEDPSEPETFAIEL